MFTGIVEHLGQIKRISQEGSNYHFAIHSGVESELYIDQSIAHNGVCLTVVEISDDYYVVTAIKETMDLTNLGHLKVGDYVNLERSVSGTTRMDGHMVQGHVDDVARVISIKEEDGSWYFSFSFDPQHASLLVSKGSICVNGVSLTLVQPTSESFQVAIIPYTYEHTNFRYLQVGDMVNLEFDIIGKYVQRYMQLTQEGKA